MWLLSRTICLIYKLFPLRSGKVKMDAIEMYKMIHIIKTVEEN